MTITATRQASTEATHPDHPRPPEPANPPRPKTARDHLLRLRLHMTVPEIAAAAGLDRCTVEKLHAHPRRGLYPATIEKLLAVPIPDRPPVYERAPVYIHRRRGRRVRVHPYRPAEWDWVKVEQVCAAYVTGPTWIPTPGPLTKDDLNPTELERVVRNLARRGASDQDISVLLRWGSKDARDPGGAVLKYRGTRGIAAGNPAARPHRTRKEVNAAAVFAGPNW